MIHVADLGFSYSNRKPLFNAYNWKAGEGETWSIIGPSGCGKTTLLYLLAGLLHPTEGDIRIAGHRISRPRPKTGLVLQDHGLLPWATIGNNVLLGFKIRQLYGHDARHTPDDAQLDTQTIEETVTYWLDRLGLSRLKDAYPSTASIGQRQRAAIARTLALNPDLLLLDEPFSSLDAPTRADLQDLLIQLHGEASGKRMTRVLVTHDINEAVYMGSRILVLGKRVNRSPVVVENPGAGRESYRQMPQCSRQCEALLALLGQNS